MQEFETFATCLLIKAGMTSPCRPNKMAPRVNFDINRIPRRNRHTFSAILGFNSEINVLLNRKKSGELQNNGCRICARNDKTSNERKIATVC